MPSDLFDEPAELKKSVRRDHWDRPYVVPKTGGKAIPYSRCTTFVGCLEDQFAVHQWQQRMTAIGIVQREDLQLTVAANMDNAKELNKVVAQAREVAGANTASRKGTAIHGLTDQIDSGESPTVPSKYQADIDAYRKATEQFKPVAIEQFVANDQLQIGGTFDRLYEFQGRYYIGDLKTGSIDHGNLKFATQFAVYANSEPYIWWDADRQEAGYEWSPEDAKLLRAEWPGEIDKERALLIHLPQGEGRCDVYWVDISRGWEAVKVAASVRAWRNAKGLMVPFSAIEEEYRDMIRREETVEGLRDIYKHWVDLGYDGELILTDCRMRKVTLALRDTSEQDLRDVGKKS